jgi:glutathione S-transferase
LPATGNAKDALTRARIAFFADTWVSKASSYSVKIIKGDSEEEKEKLVKEFLGVVQKEIEPLLKDAAPFFGGSSKTTMAEVCAKICGN